MLQIRNILYPTDFSDSAAAAFPYAVHLARAHHATIHMLHVAHVPGLLSVAEAVEVGMADLTVPEDVRNEAELQMDALVWSHEADDVTIKRVHAQHATPGAVLLKYAEVQDVDLIVMGSHGRTGVRRVVLGSVAETVIRQASCPVLVVRQQEGQAGQPVAGKRLMVPFDFSSQAEHALRYAHELAPVYDTAVDVVHVLDPGTHLEAYVEEVAEHGRMQKQLTREARTALEKINTELGGPEIDASYTVLVGYPPREITEFALQNDSGVIVMSSHGRTGKKSILMGSVAEHVVRHAPCPVFIARPFGKSLLPHGRIADARQAGD